METVRTSGRFFRGGLVESERVFAICLPGNPMLERNQRPLITRHQSFLRLIVMGRGIDISRYRNSLLWLE